MTSNERERLMAIAERAHQAMLDASGAWDGAVAHQHLHKGLRDVFGMVHAAIHAAAIQEPER